MNPDDEPDLRRALHDAVADIRPEGTLEQIRTRTHEVVTMNRRWILPTLAAAALVAAVVGGVFLLTKDEDSLGPAGTPTQGTSAPGPSATATPDDTQRRAVPLYFVGETSHGRRLYREFQAQQVCATDECLAKAAAVTAVSGTPLDHDYTAPWPAGTGVNAASYDGNVLTVDLSGPVQALPSGMTRAEAELAVQQLLFSAQAGLGKGQVPVQLLVDGKHSDTVLGVPSSEPLATGNPDDLESAIQVDTPADGTTVSSPFTVSGRAATFEANVVWELEQGGTVVKKGFTTAQECCTLAPYSFEVSAPPGTYTLVVHDTDDSGQGRPVDRDTKEITVR